MKIGLKSHKLLNKQKSSRASLANCVRDLGRKNVAIWANHWFLLVSMPI